MNFALQSQICSAIALTPPPPFNKILAKKACFHPIYFVVAKG